MRRRASWIGLLVGLAAGLGIGLFYTWMVNPVIETGTAPWQLADNPRDAQDLAPRDQYMAMIGLAYQYNQNFARAEERIMAFNFDRPGLEVARRACDFFRRAEDMSLTMGLVDLAHAYGEVTCVDADMLGPTAAPTPTGTAIIVVPTATPTLTPTPTVTPSPAPTDTPDPALITPTVASSPTPTGPFEPLTVSAFCNPRFSGVIEVYVQEADRTGLPGVEVLVTWEGGEDRFFTGLQPGDDPGFANFVMTEANKTYRVELPGRGGPSRPLEARPCTPLGGLEDGEVVLTGYVVPFRRSE